MNRRLSVPLLAGAMLLTGTALHASCMFTRGPRLLKAHVEACRSAEPDIRAAMDPYLEGEKRWAGDQPERKVRVTYMQWDIEERVAKKEAVATLKVESFRQLSEYPGGIKEVTAEPWQKAETGKAEDYLIPGGCDGLAAGKEVLVLERFSCCDTGLPTDNACILKLPAILDVTQDKQIQEKFGASPRPGHSGD